MIDGGTKNDFIKGGSMKPLFLGFWGEQAHFCVARWVKREVARAYSKIFSIF